MYFFLLLSVALVVSTVVLTQNLNFSCFVKLIKAKTVTEW